jgi:peroxiredoxin
MRDNIAKYQNLHAEILAISVDTPLTLEKFKEEQQLNFTLLSDFNKEVSMSYGALYDEFIMRMRGVSRRSAFVIDRDGVVRYAQVNESASEMPNFESVKETLSNLN